jgi:transcription elongation factor Elf1
MRLAERLKRLEAKAQALVSPTCPRCGKHHLDHLAEEDLERGFCLCRECCGPVWQREAPELAEEIVRIVAGT